MVEYFDLSQPIKNGMTNFPGDPVPVIQLAEGVTVPWRVTDLKIGSHTGTHIDASAHYFELGRSIDRYPLDRFVLKGICISVEGLAADEPIPIQRIARACSRLKEGDAVVIRTGWDQYWGEEQYLHHPYLSLEAAQAIKSVGAGLIGIDALNVDSTILGTGHVHKIFLGSEMLIVENLRGLEQLIVGEEYHFSFLPLRLSGLDGSPIRAIAWR
jgi:arylformamidase